MKRYNGKSAGEGIAVGPVVIWRKQIQVEKREAEDPQKEVERFLNAISQAKSQLEALYSETVSQVGEIGAAVFEVHRMMLLDPSFGDAVEKMIRNESVNAEYAVLQTGEQFSLMFASMPDEYMSARAADMRDIVTRLIRCLQQKSEKEMRLMRPAVIVAEDLSPSETVRLDKEKILAIVTEKGSIYSHTAILAKMMNIPAIVATQISPMDIHDGETAIVNGTTGEVIFSPDDKTLKNVQRQARKAKESKALLDKWKGKEDVTADGVKLDIFANIGNPTDVEAVIENDAKGIGLFRSEFLYLGREEFPTEEEQYEAYKAVAKRMSGRKVIIRTMDIGSDKKEAYFELKDEINPALGCRAIRFCLRRPELFKTQLRALLRAAYEGNIAILYPMIISEKEVKEIYQLVEECAVQLEAEGKKYRVPEQGVMIETPAAVMISDRLAKQVDFFSIGTNDLAQYTLALDRQNESMDDFYDPHHEAVLRMIEMTVANAHAAGKRVGICGELAADISLTGRFASMGVDELSVAPAMILKIRKKLGELCVKDEKNGMDAWFTH